MNEYKLYNHENPDFAKYVLEFGDEKRLYHSVDVKFIDEPHLAVFNWDNNISFINNVKEFDKT